MSKTPKYIYWIENDGGGIGAWRTIKQAKAFIKNLNPDSSRRIVKYPAQKCHLCGRIDTKENLEAYGKCLWCEDNYPNEPFYTT